MIYPRLQTVLLCPKRFSLLYYFPISDPYSISLFLLSDLIAMRLCLHQGIYFFPHRALFFKKFLSTIKMFRGASLKNSYTIIALIFMCTFYGWKMRRIATVKERESKKKRRQGRDVLWDPDRSIKLLKLPKLWN